MLASERMSESETALGTQCGVSYPSLKHSPIITTFPMMMKMYTLYCEDN